MLALRWQYYVDGCNVCYVIDKVDEFFFVSVDDDGAAVTACHRHRRHFSSTNRP